MSNDSVSDRLDQIQSQLAKLQESYGNIARTYYNIFYNPVGMDVELTLYNNDGELETITVPNRAKDATDKVYRSSGDPNGVVSANLGSLCFDEVNFKLYFKARQSGSTSEGWIEVLARSNFAPNMDYIPYHNGDGTYLTKLNAQSIEAGILPVERGGTGSQELSGILKGVPTVKDAGGNIITPGYVTTAEAGVDYTSISSFVSIICFAPMAMAPEGFLICDGAAYRIDHYGPLYEIMTRRYDVKGEPYHVKFPLGDGDEGAEEFTDKSKSYYVEDVTLPDGTIEYSVEFFRVPDLLGYFPRFWSPNPVHTVDSEPERNILSVQLDGVPNIKGEWVQEITGIAEENFNGAISIPKDSNGNPKQVTGKTSAPGGYYDYVLDFDASRVSKVYRNDSTEVTVKNVALLPIIKYALGSYSTTGE